MHVIILWSCVLSEIYCTMYANMNMRVHIMYICIHVQFPLYAHIPHTQAAHAHIPHTQAAHAHIPHTQAAYWKQKNTPKLMTLQDSPFWSFWSVACRLPGRWRGNESECPRGRSLAPLIEPRSGYHNLYFGYCWQLCTCECIVCVVIWYAYVYAYTYMYMYMYIPICTCICCVYVYVYVNMFIPICMHTCDMCRWMFI